MVNESLIKMIFLSQRSNKESVLCPWILQKKETTKCTLVWTVESTLPFEFYQTAKSHVCLKPTRATRQARL